MVHKFCSRPRIFLFWLVQLDTLLEGCGGINREVNWVYQARSGAIFWCWNEIFGSLFELDCTTLFFHGWFDWDWVQNTLLTEMALGRIFYPDSWISKKIQSAKNLTNSGLPRKFKDRILVWGKFLKPKTNPDWIKFQESGSFIQDLKKKFF